jgi:hypothetical protein
MSVIMRVGPPPQRSQARDDDGPSLVEFVEGVVSAVDGMVIGGTVFPGILLCVPAILFVVVPVVLLGALVALVALAAAAPVVGLVLLGRFVGRHPVRLHRAAPDGAQRRRSPERVRGALVMATRGDGDA